MGGDCTRVREWVGYGEEGTAKWPSKAKRGDTTNAYEHQIIHVIAFQFQAFYYASIGYDVLQ
jgi:hypothetical protein